MKISILTLFPEMFEGPFGYSILKHAVLKKLLEIEYVNIRNFGIGRHKIVDDRTYGGGVGMVMRVDVLQKAIEKTKCHPPTGGKKKCKEKVVLLDPQGKVFKQKVAEELSKLDHLILVCSHYEGIDERIRNLVDLEISIGDYVLTGGEIPAMVLTDTIARLIPNVLGKVESNKNESFQNFSTDKKTTLLEYPQYTKPQEFQNKKVPEILLSGDHAKIKEWREKEALKRTKERRPDLLTGKGD